MIFNIQFRVLPRQFASRQTSRQGQHRRFRVLLFRHISNVGGKRK